MSQPPPSRQEQIVQAHADLIVQVVKATHSPEQATALEPVLRTTRENGWTDLVAAIRRILNGERDQKLFAGLDEEDSAIVEAMLRGIQNPATLPDPEAKPDPTLAAPGLANMIHESTRGNTEALQLLANMGEQMSQVGGDMGRLGGILRRLVEGERDPDKLSEGMETQGRIMVNQILEELGRLEQH